MAEFNEEIQHPLPLVNGLVFEFWVFHEWQGFICCIQITMQNFHHESFQLSRQGTWEGLNAFRVLSLMEGYHCPDSISLFEKL